jgi:hypothetical protein
MLKTTALRFWRRAGQQYSSLITMVTCIVACAANLDAQELFDAWSAAFPPNTMKLVEVKQGSDGTVFDLKNVAGKPITAFAISRSNDSVTDAIDFFRAKDDLAPGDTYSLRIGQQGSLRAIASCTSLRFCLRTGRQKAYPLK